MIDRLQLKNRAREILLKDQHTPNIFLISLIYGIIIVILGNIRTYLSGMPTSNELYEIYNNAIQTGVIPSLSKYITVRGISFYLISTILSVLISLGFTIYTLKILRRKSTSFWTLFEGFEYFFKFLGLCILTGLIEALGTIALIVPGFIFMLMFSQARYIMLDNPGLGAVGCMRESARIIKGHKWEYFVLGVSLLGWYLLCVLGEVLLPNLGLVPGIWVYPYSGLIFAQYYEALKAQPSPDSGEQGII